MYKCWIAKRMTLRQTWLTMVSYERIFKRESLLFYYAASSVCQLVWWTRSDVYSTSYRPVTSNTPSRMRNHIPPNAKLSLVAASNQTNSKPQFDKYTNIIITSVRFWGLTYQNENKTTQIIKNVIIRLSFRTNRKNVIIRTRYYIIILIYI